MRQKGDQLATQERIQSLTSLRFFAALVVVLFHYSLSFPLLGEKSIKVSSLGVLGVSFFFVLSGYILTYTYLSKFAHGVGWSDYRDFIVNRLSRIWPMYAVALVLGTLVAGIVSITNPSFLWRGISPVPGTMELVSSWMANLAMVHIYVSSPVQYLWNGPAWSIPCELFFYLLFPFILFLVTQVGRLRPAYSLGLLLMVMCIQLALVMGAGRAIPEHIWQSPLITRHLAYDIAYLPFYRVWEFTVGVIMGYLAFGLPQGHRFTTLLADSRLRQMALTACLGVLGANAIVLVAIRGTSVIVDLWFLFFALPFGALILLTGSGPTWLTKSLDLPILVLLGEASYSLYLIHILPLNLLNSLRAGGIHIPTWLAYLAIPVTITGSVLCFKFIEEPSRRLLRGAYAQLTTGSNARNSIPKSGVNLTGP